MPVGLGWTGLDYYSIVPVPVSCSVSGFVAHGKNHRSNAKSLVSSLHWPELESHLCILPAEDCGHFSNFQASVPSSENGNDWEDELYVVKGHLKCFTLCLAFGEDSFSVGWYIIMVIIWHIVLLLPLWFPFDSQFCWYILSLQALPMTEYPYELYRLSQCIK